MAREIGARVVVGIAAFVMIASGVGTTLAIFLGLTYLTQSPFLVLQVPYWTHGFSLFLPGVLGIFVSCGCGWCNIKPAYVTSAVVDGLGVLSFLGSLSQLWALDAMLLVYGELSCYRDVSGSCICTGDSRPGYYGRVLEGFTFSSYVNCDLYPILFNCGIVLTTVWVLGFLALTVHLILVIYLACSCKEEATTGQVMGMSGSQGAMQMTSLPSAYHQGGSAPPSYTQPGFTQHASSMYNQPTYTQHAPSMFSQPTYTQHAPSTHSQPTYTQHAPSTHSQPDYSQHTPSMQSQQPLIQYARHSYREQGHTGITKQGSRLEGQGSYFPPGYLSQGVPSGPLNITAPNSACS